MSDALATIERLLIDADQVADSRARGLVKALATALIELVGEGLLRVNQIGGDDLARKLADDEIVGNLLVLCGVHPDPAAVRARYALEHASAELRSVGVVLDAVDVEASRVRVTVRGQYGELLDAGRVRAVVEAIVIARAPDIDVIELVVGEEAGTAGGISTAPLKVVG